MENVVRFSSEFPTSLLSLILIIHFSPLQPLKLLFRETSHPFDWFTIFYLNGSCLPPVHVPFPS